MSARIPESFKKAVDLSIKAAFAEADGFPTLEALWAADHEQTLMPYCDVRISAPKPGARAWSVSLMDPLRRVPHPLSSYLPVTKRAAMRVAALLFARRPIPRDYRRWR